MKSFDVLDESLDIYKSHLLEASAGTGKTYSIENIVVRLLIERREEKIPPTIDQILVVTFTRAATQELKGRIRSNIERVLALLIKGRQGEIWDDTYPSYLKPIFRKGEKVLKEASRDLEDALLGFDEAEIFTIHGFCYRILREVVFEKDLNNNERKSEDNPMPMLSLLEIVKDYFRTGLSPENYSSAQIHTVLKNYKNDIENVARELIRVALRGITIKGGEPFLESFQGFKEVLKELKEMHSWDEKKLIEDFEMLAPCYYKVYSASEKKKSKEMFLKFACLFSKEECSQEHFNDILNDGFSIFNKLLPEKKKKTAKLPDDSMLHFPGAIESLEEAFGGVVRGASSPQNNFARMAEECRLLIQKVFFHEEIFTPDDILKEMKKAIDDKELIKVIRKKYRAAIVDEFQDTDPIQWNIFKRLFLPDDGSWGPIYLVGDPKQSIYGFRSADIYTYLDACQAM